MLRLPAVAGQFYPGTPEKLSLAVRMYTQEKVHEEKVRALAALVPHAGYVYSGGVAGAVFSRLKLPKKILLLGVRHYPRGAALAILSEGAWRTPLGDVPIDTPLASRLKSECPLLEEDSVAHSREHSLEVELPFLQMLAPGFSFVPVAVGTIRFEDLLSTGEAIARVLGESKEEILMVASSDMNHYEDEETTRRKDRMAIDRLLAMDAKGLYEICREEEISMCGLGPAVIMLTAVKRLGATKAELLRHATSGDSNGERDAVVGYAGMIFR